MPIVVTYTTRRSNMYELLCCSSISNAKYLAEDLDTFERIWRNDIKKHPKKSTGSVEDFYELSRNGDRKKVRIWHLNAKGERDRLVATIENK